MTMSVALATTPFTTNIVGWKLEQVETNVGFCILCVDQNLGCLVDS